MVKRFLRISRRVIAPVVAGCIASCAGRPEIRLPDPVGAKPVWQKSAGGLITDLNVSADGQRALVATVPHPDKAEDADFFQVAFWDEQGNRVSSSIFTDRVKSQAISPEGDLAIVRTYDGKLSALRSDGKIRWTVEADCKPLILGTPHVIVCFHDDDPVPGTAFDVYSAEGKKRVSRRVEGDVLEVEATFDAGLIIVAATGGRVLGFGPNFRSAFDADLPGEIVDLAISQGRIPRVLVLSSVPAEGQVFYVLDRKGKIVGQGKAPGRFDQVEISPDGRLFFAARNSASGQELIGLTTPKDLREASHQMTPLWRYSEVNRAEYVPSIAVTRDRLLAGIETRENGTRVSRIQAWDFQGARSWSVPVATEEGGYLHGQGSRRSGVDAVLFVATDTGELQAYRAESADPNSTTRP